MSYFGDFFEQIDKLIRKIDNFKENEAHEIAVAGMGGLLISSFIERTIWLKNIIISILSRVIHIIYVCQNKSKNLYKKNWNHYFRKYC